MRNALFKYVLQKYKTEPDQPFVKFPTYQALRHKDNRKIYALIMDVKRGNLGINGGPDEYVDIINIKCTADYRALLLMAPGFLPCYYMHSGSWISILLDGTVNLEKICELLDISYELTDSRSKSRKNKLHNPDWLVPANPKYYDIEKAISDGNGVFLWKQSSSILVDDTVYLYIAAPVSAIKYQCHVLEADIPFSYSDENVHMKTVMKLQVMHTYEDGLFPIQKLRTFGVTAIRGPRSLPDSLLQELKLTSDNSAEQRNEETYG